MSVFSDYKDLLIDKIEHRSVDDLAFPLEKLGTLLNGYTGGDFIVIGGRKTSGKSYFALNNYVISPLIQRISAKKNNLNIKLKVVYISTRFSLKHTMDRMVINYISQQSGGNKISIPAIYGLKGNHAKLDAQAAKGLFSNAFDVFDTLVDKGILHVIAGKRSILEIEAYIHSIMEELGSVDEDGDFEYDEEHEGTKVIIVVDDALSMSKEVGSSSSFEFGTKVASTLRTMAKKFTATVVLTVPTTSFYKREKVHRSSTADVAPYNLYCDRSIVLHNPVETDDFKFINYDVDDFVNESTGIYYFRSAFIASNSTGASGVYIPLFLMPENGYFEEMPSSTDEFGLDNIKEKI